MILNIYYSICGFAEAEVSGGLPERFINACTENGIFIWNVRRKGEKLSFSVKGSTAGKLSEIADASGCRVEITGYRGLKYFAAGFGKRYALMFGIFAFSAVIAFAGSLVWRIDIDGCKNVKVSEVKKILAENGIKTRCFKRKIDAEKISDKIVCGIRGVSWAGAELKGTVLKIEIKERREIPYMVDADSPYDIVAAKDGVITEMRIRNGEKVKKPGDKVKKGEIIVSSLVEKDGENELPNPYTVHSFGEVIARTWYEYDIEQPLFYEKNSYSGAYFNRKRIKISKIPINLYFRGSILYAEYDKIIKSNGFFVKFENETFFEKKTIRHELSCESAVELAVCTAAENLPDNILSARCVGSDYKLQNDCIGVHVIFECTENIAVEQRYTERREINDNNNSGNG